MPFLRIVRNLTVDYWKRQVHPRVPMEVDVRRHVAVPNVRLWWLLVRWRVLLIWPVLFFVVF
eukprot:scaffold320962_cov43-Attheya_sp.AAC.1